MNRTLVTLATYNEIENLPALVAEIFEICPDVDILVIDDNSPDGSGRWCDEHRAAEPRLQCIHRAAKLGLGTATVAGLRYAIEHDYERVLNMDADFSHHPRYLRAILAGLDETVDGRPVDVSIGSRYVAGGAIEGWPWRRFVMSRCVNSYARTLLGLAPQDCSGSYRCYRISTLRKVDFSDVRSRGYSFQEEILFHLARLDAVMRETPITFVDRQKGKSKINTQEGLAAVRLIFALGVRRMLGRAKPLPAI